MRLKKPTSVRVLGVPIFSVSCDKNLYYTAMSVVGEFRIESDVGCKEIEYAPGVKSPAFHYTFDFFYFFLLGSSKFPNLFLYNGPVLRHFESAKEIPALGRVGRRQTALGL
jgi:hypothetical protein